MVINQPYRLHFRFIVIVFILLISFLARDVGIEPTHRGFGDLTDTLSVSRIGGASRLRSGSSGFSDQCFYQVSLGSNFGCYMRFEPIPWFSQNQMLTATTITPYKNKKSELISRFGLFSISIYRNYLSIKFEQYSFSTEPWLLNQEDDLLK